MRESTLELVAQTLLAAAVAVDATQLRELGRFGITALLSSLKTRATTALVDVDDVVRRIESSDGETLSTDGVAFDDIVSFGYRVDRWFEDVSLFVSPSFDMFLDVQAESKCATARVQGRGTAARRL